MKRLIGLIAILVLLVSVSCAKAQVPVTVPATTSAPKMGEIVPAPAPPRVGAPPPVVITQVPAPTIKVSLPTPAPAPLPPGMSGAGEPDRMIVRTGQMSLVVTDIPVAIDAITRLAESYKGYVVSSNSWREGERLRGAITIRVPAGDFGSVMKSLSDLAVEVTSQTTSSKDVTEEYVDLDARLQNLEATEQQLLRIMEKAEKVEDILNVQRELSRTRGEIEQTKARMQYLERTSATSLIDIRLEQSKLDVKFNADKRFVKAGEGIYFKSQIVGGFTPYSYQWDFGDGETSTDMAPTHAYKSSGSYTVSLKVTDDRGNTDSETTKDYITVLSGWEAGNTASSAWNGLVTFGHVLANIFIWLGIFSPVWVILGGGALWWRYKRSKRASRP